MDIDIEYVRDLAARLPAEELITTIRRWEQLRNQTAAQIYRDELAHRIRPLPDATYACPACKTTWSDGQDYCPECYSRGRERRTVKTIWTVNNLPCTCEPSITFTVNPLCEAHGDPRDTSIDITRLDTCPDCGGMGGFDEPCAICGKTAFVD